MRRVRGVLLAFVVLAGVLLTAAPALAACNSLSISPNPGYRGANITISGTGWTANDTIYVNFNGDPIGTTMSDGSGNWSLLYKIPNDYPTGTVNVFAYDGPDNCEANPSYTVNASAPTTTTTAPPTTTTTATTTTTTTLAPTTTTTVAKSTTTTLAATTTTAAATTTTGAATTTTTAAPAGGGGSSSTLLYVLIGVIVVLVAALAFTMGRRRRS